MKWTRLLEKFQKQRDVVKGINVVMRSAGEVMTLLIQEMPEFARLYAKKKERLLLFEMMKRKKGKSDIVPSWGKPNLGSGFSDPVSMLELILCMSIVKSSRDSHAGRRAQGHCRTDLPKG